MRRGTLATLAAHYARGRRRRRARSSSASAPPDDNGRRAGGYRPAAAVAGRRNAGVEGGGRGRAHDRAAEAGALSPAAGAKDDANGWLTRRRAPQSLPARPSQRMAGGGGADAEGLSHRRAALPHEARRDRPDRPARRPRADRRGQGAADADRGDGGDRPRIRAAHRGRGRSVAGAAAGLSAGCRCASTWWRCCRGAGRCMSRTFSTGATERGPLPGDQALTCVPRH